MPSQTPDRRREARLRIPRHLTELGLDLRLVRLLDLSAKGAPIEHPDSLRDGLVCYLDLPPALGRATLTGKVVWTRPHKREQTYEGETRAYYHSGLAFVEPTPEQREALTAALRILETGELPDGT